MRRKNGILIFENLEEEKRSIEDGGFQGIFIAKQECIMGSCDVLEIYSRKKKFITNIDTFYLYGGNKNNELKDKIVEQLSKKSPFSLEMGIPEISISIKLNHIFGV